MPQQQLTLSRLKQILAHGFIWFLSPLFLIACDRNEVDELNEQTLKHIKEVRTTDSLAITKYIADSSFTNVQRQPSGLYIVTRRPGTGNLPQAGQQVSVIYKGTFLNNRVFDQSVLGADSKLVPIMFPLGRGQVIAGWDEGIGLMRKGQKAILLIPSALAYGTAGSRNTIPPDTPLRFDVELTEIN
ncbi:FKBP-type peptidyl-prolyl cis-trans isomerase [uncultured Hymenobacter sp.]|uniref:FKBP-type peptidyl-prolyl cis-trans isomerase n=1 Tax=uncultured Hymenobacter sp. TaxID=170016 RepID=UPI0035CBEF42